MSVFDISEFDRQFTTDVVQSAGEPVVTPRRVVIEQPAPSQSFDLHTDASRRGDFGTPDEMIAYLRQVNRIPDNASALIEFEPIRRLTHITFEWWDIEIKVKRRHPLGRGETATFPLGGCQHCGHLASEHRVSSADHPDPCRRDGCSCPDFAVTRESHRDTGAS